MKSAEEMLLARMSRLEYLVDYLRSKTGGGGGGTSITGTGLWHNVAGVLQAAALIGTPGQFVVANTTPDSAFVSISGDVSASTTTPGKLTVTGLRGVSVPAPSGTNTILQFNGTTLSWTLPAAGTSVTGTGLWHNVSGVLQAAALIGTPGQFCVTNTTPDATFVTITGDVAASTAVPGLLTVAGIQGVAVPAPSGTNTILTFNGTTFSWTSAPGASITGTGLWHNISGVLQPAALIGTAGQFVVANTTPDSAFVTITGDVSASTSIPGKLTVTGLQGVAVPTPSGTNTVLTFNGGVYTWGTGTGVSVTGTGLWHNISGVLQAAALIGTSGQFVVANNTPDAAFVTISGDVSASTVTPGKLTVTGLQGVAVPTPTGTNTVLNFNAGTFTWVAAGTTVSVTGTGLWHNIGGALQAAALIGTAGQFYLVNTTPDAACVTLSGDVTASTTTPGKITVVGLQGIAVPAPSGSNTVLQFNGGVYTWAPGAFTTVTGTGLWHNVGGVLQAAALVGTVGQFCVTNATPDATFVTITGDVSASTVTPGLLTVVGIRGVSVPAPSGSNTVLEFNGTTLSWATAAVTQTVTGTGLWHNIAGTLQAAALIGTAGQFYLVNTTPDAACVSISGDVSASTSTVGKLTVTGIQNIAVPAPTGTNTVLTFNAGAYTWASSSGTFTPGSDLLGNGTSTSTNQFVSSISFSSAGAGGTVNVNGTNTLFNFVTNAITFQQNATTLLQLKALGTDFVRFGTTPGTSGSIRATANTIIIGVNGNSVLQTDTGPATFLNGTGIFLQLGNVSQATLTTAAFSLLPPNILFTTTSGIGTATIGFTSPGSAGGAVLVVRAQGATGPNVGGALVLESGVGAAADGNINFANGNTTTAILTETSFQLLPPEILFTATGGAATTIGFNSSATSGASLSLNGQNSSTGAFGGGVNINAGTSTTSGNQGQITFNCGNVQAGILSQAGFILDVPLGGDPNVVNVPFRFAADQTSGNIAVASTSFALSVAQYTNVELTLFGSLTTNITLTMPNIFGAFWVIDIRFVTFNGFSITFAPNGGGNTVSFGGSFDSASTGFILYVARTNSMGLVG